MIVISDLLPEASVTVPRRDTWPPFGGFFTVTAPDATGALRQV